MNLIDQIKSSITDAAIGKIAGFAGADESTVKNVINMAIPSLIGGVSQAGNSAEGASSIFNTLKGFFDTNSNELSADSNMEEVSNQGTQLLGSLLGNNTLSSITSALSSESGVASGGIRKILGAIAPMVLGMLFKNSGGASNFLGFLGDSGKSISGLLPAGLGSLLGGASNISSNIGSGIGNTASQLATEAGETSDGFFGLLKRFLPLLLLLALLAFLWMFFNKGCKGGTALADTSLVDSTTMNQDATTAASETLDSAAILAKEAWKALGDMTSVKLPDGTEIQVPANGDEKKLIDFLAGGCEGDIKTSWFNMDRLLFNTGSSELNAVSNEQLSNVSKIFKAYQAATFKIGGYTDNVGNVASNKKLSNERATAVLSSLTGNGIEAARLEAEGYGPEHPVCAANDTDECKAKNRRVAVRVTKCK